jgi:hypothetical protein
MMTKRDPEMSPWKKMMAALWKMSLVSVSYVIETENEVLVAACQIGVPYALCMPASYPVF